MTPTSSVSTLALKQVSVCWVTVNIPQSLPGIPASICLLKNNNRHTRTSSEICSRLTIKTLEQCQWRCSGVFNVNFEHISQLVLVFLLLTCMHFFAWTAVYFIFFSVCHIFFFDKTWKSKNMSWYANFLQKFLQLILGYFLNIATFILGLLFQKSLWLLEYFYVVVKVDDFGHIYTPLVAQRQFRRLQMKQWQDIYRRCWLFECM